MSAITIDFSQTAAVQALSRLGGAGDRAARRSLKRTTTSVRALMGSLVAKDIGLPVTAVKKEIRVTVTADERGASIGVTGAPIPLIAFRATGPIPTRGRGRSVTASIGGQRKTYPGAFIATVGSGGHRGVFKRVGTSSRRSKGAWAKNLPIIQLYGPSLPHVFAKYLPEGAARAEEQMTKNLEHELAFELSKLKE